MMRAPGPIAVIGAGSWGTALAVLLARNAQSVRLWGRDREAMARLARERSNARYLPGVVLPPALRVGSDLADALRGADDVLLAVPSHAFRDTLAAVAAERPALQALAWVTKGLEPGGGRFLSDIVADHLGRGSSRALLSGPTFAGEVARGLPTAVTLAGNADAYVRRLATRFHADAFRVYTSDDLVGVQLCGAVKNVLAIAAGIGDGLGLGANTRAALITRGLAEVTRLGVALGGRAETFVGLAGLGDLLLTCTDDQSRNRRFGIALAHGMSIEQAAAHVGQVVEGLGNAREVSSLARRHAVEMPIAEQVHRVLFHGVEPGTAVRALLARRSRSETD
jgi:glycerol-3-phosphate dehydrogenase (NAD(P)+)